MRLKNKIKGGAVKKELRVVFKNGSKEIETFVRTIDVSEKVSTPKMCRLSEPIELNHDNYYTCIGYINLKNCTERGDGTLVLENDLERSNEFLFKMIEEKNWASEERMEQSASDLLEKCEITVKEYNQFCDYIKYELFGE